MFFRSNWFVQKQQNEKIANEQPVFLFFVFCFCNVCAVVVLYHYYQIHQLDIQFAYKMMIIPVTTVIHFVSTIRHWHSSCSWCSNNQKRFCIIIISMDTILIEDHRTLQAILGKFSVFVCFFLGKQNEKFFSRIQKMRKVSSNRKKRKK